MKRFTIGEVIQAVQGQPSGPAVAAKLRWQPEGVSTDSRTLRPGQLFVALAGERFDGHRFVGEALNKGAGAVVVSRQWAAANPEALKNIPLAILVEHTLRALQELARWYRSLFAVPVIAVTGTNGKTTTKDMIAAILSQQARGLWTEGNQNNHIGLPLTLLRLQEEHRFAVVELGMRAAGEIAELTAICRPEVGVITNVGPAHIQFFRSVEDIARAKGELLDGLGASGTAVLNGDDELVMAQRGRAWGKVLTFGLGSDADVRAGDLRLNGWGGFSFVATGGLPIELRVPGKHMVMNALAAVAVGREFGVAGESVTEALASFRPQPMRMEVIHVDSLHILNDTYNANPASMRAALQTLREVSGTKRKIAVLGDMLELGEWASRVHRDIGQLAAQSGLAYLLTVGELSRLIAEEAMVSGMAGEQVHHVSGVQEALAFLRETARSGDAILVKGSRQMGLEAVVEGLRKQFTASTTSQGAK